MATLAETPLPAEFRPARIVRDVDSVRGRSVLYYADHLYGVTALLGNVPSTTMHAIVIGAEWLQPIGCGDADLDRWEYFIGGRIDGKRDPGWTASPRAAWGEYLHTLRGELSAAGQRIWGGSEGRILDAFVALCGWNPDGDDAEDRSLFGAIRKVCDDGGDNRYLETIGAIWVLTTIDWWSRVPGEPVYGLPPDDASSITRFLGRLVWWAVENRAGWFADESHTLANDDYIRGITAGRLPRWMNQPSASLTEEAIVSEACFAAAWQYARELAVGCVARTYPRSAPKSRDDLVDDLTQDSILYLLESLGRPRTKSQRGLLTLSDRDRLETALPVFRHLQRVVATKWKSRKSAARRVRESARDDVTTRRARQTIPAGVPTPTPQKRKWEKVDLLDLAAPSSAISPVGKNVFRGERIARSAAYLDDHDTVAHCSGMDTGWIGRFAEEVYSILSDTMARMPAETRQKVEGVLTGEGSGWSARRSAERALRKFLGETWTLLRVEFAMDQFCCEAAKAGRMARMSESSALQIAEKTLYSMVLALIADGVGENILEKT